MALPPVASTPRIQIVRGELADLSTSDPHLARLKTPITRSFLIQVGSAICFALLFMMGWLCDVNVMQGETLRADWARQGHRSEKRLPPRGQIYDRAGTILGETRSTWDCWVDAPRIDERIVPEFASMLADATQGSAEEFERLLDRRIWRSELFRDMTPELHDAMHTWKTSGWRHQAHAFAETEAGKALIVTRFEGSKQAWYTAVSSAVGDVTVQSVDRRTYPLGALAGQVLGFVTERKEGIAPGGGIELWNQQQLAGDAPAAALTPDSEALLVGKPALGVQLTLDADVQTMTEQALARGLQRTRAKSGVAIVMDAESGDLLAIANVPVFDPGLYQRWQAQTSQFAIPASALIPDANPADAAIETDDEPQAPTTPPVENHPPLFESWPISNELMEHWTDPTPPGLIPGISETHQRNAALIWQVEPGSIFKPFTMLAALEHGKVQVTDTVVIGPAPLILDRREIQDHHWPSTNEVWDMTKVMVKSSNKGMAKVALRTGRGPIIETLQKLHFGEQLLGLPGEGAGRIGLSREMWRDSELATMGFGHGLVMVTPLQITAAMNAIATGSYIKPRLRMAYQLADGRWREEPPAAREATIDPVAIAQVQLMLEAVVSDEGTGHKAVVPGYRVAGKTGTAKKTGPGGYQKGVYYSSFLGYGPVEKPRYTVLVMYDEPQVDKYGGLAAAPVFSELMEWLLQRDARDRAVQEESGKNPDWDLILARG